MRIGIFLTSRNNYEMFEKVWFKNINCPGVEILNIDEDSTPEQKTMGKDVCKRLGIHYLDRELAGMQNNIVTACNFFKDKADCIIWFQHDCWPIEPDFFERFNKIVESGRLSDFGVIGFNGLATDILKDYKSAVKSLRSGQKPLGLVGRSSLTKYRWYSGCPTRFPVLPNLKEYDMPFAVESVAWFAAAVNIKSYMRHIEPDSNYGFFHAWDDVCFQFLNKNIYNIVLPSLYIDHRPDRKIECNIPTRSVKLAKRGDDTFHTGWGHLDVWKKKWGYDWEDTDSFGKVAERFRGTLLWDIRHHDFNSGPLKKFNIERGL